MRRRPTPYPLGHGGEDACSFSLHLLNYSKCFDIHLHRWNFAIGLVSEIMLVVIVDYRVRLRLKYMFWLDTRKPKARFRRRTFHEPNLIHWIKYMKSSASESIRNACFNLERLSRSFRLARPGISPLDRLRNAFDSDAALFMYRTKCRNSYNVFCKQFDRNAYFSPSEFSSAGIKIGVWITLAGLNNLCRP